jgi:hypothetical protein
MGVIPGQFAQVSLFDPKGGAYRRPPPPGYDPRSGACPLDIFGQTCNGFGLFTGLGTGYLHILLGDKNRKVFLELGKVKNHSSKTSLALKSPDEPPIPVIFPSHTKFTEPGQRESAAPAQYRVMIALIPGYCKSFVYFPLLFGGFLRQKERFLNTPHLGKVLGIKMSVPLCHTVRLMPGHGLHLAQGHVSHLQSRVEKMPPTVH